MSEAFKMFRQLVMSQTVMEVISKRDRADRVHDPDRPERDKHCGARTDPECDRRSARDNGPGDALHRDTQCRLHVWAVELR